MWFCVCRGKSRSSCATSQFTFCRYKVNIIFTSHRTQMDKLHIDISMNRHITEKCLLSLSLSYHSQSNTHRALTPATETRNESFFCFAANWWKTAREEWRRRVGYFNHKSQNVGLDYYDYPLFFVPSNRKPDKLMLNERLTVCRCVHINQAQCFVSLLFFSCSTGASIFVRTNTIVPSAKHGRCADVNGATHSHCRTLTMTRMTTTTTESPLGFWAQRRPHQYFQVVSVCYRVAVVAACCGSAQSWTTFITLTFGCAQCIERSAIFFSFQLHKFLFTIKILLFARLEL